MQARIGIINRTINMLDFLLAQEVGIYRKHDLEVTFDTLAGRESIQALQAGQLDVVLSIGAAVRTIMEDGAPLKVALLVHRNAPHWVMARTAFKSARDLKGRKVQAAQPGSEPDVMVRRWLRENDLDPERDVELTYERAHPGWTEDGPDPKEDAVIARTLEQEVLEARGFHTLIELCSTYPNTLVHGLVVQEPTLAERPGMLAALVKSHREVASWIDEGREEVLAFIQRQWGVSRERAERATRSLNGKFVARLEPEDFGPVIAASSAATGKPPIPVTALLAPIHTD